MYHSILLLPFWLEALGLVEAFFVCLFVLFICFPLLSVLARASILRWTVVVNPCLVLDLRAWLSICLRLQTIKTVSHVMVTPTIKFLLLHNCNFVDRNYNINIWYEEYLICDPPSPVKGPFDLQRGHNPQVENHCLEERLFFFIITYGTNSGLFLYSP